VAGRRATFAGAAAVLAAVTVLAAGALISGGAPWRFSPREVDLASYVYFDPHDARELMRYGVCFIPEMLSARDFPVAKCLPDKPGQPKLLVIGDSHAATMWFGLDQVLQGFNVMQATAVGCKPVLHQAPRQAAECAKIMDYVLTQYLPAHRVDAVLLQAHWYPVDIPAVEETLEWLRGLGIPAVLVGPMPQYDSQLPRLLVFAIRHGDPQLPRRHLVGMFETLDRQMAAAFRDDRNVRYVSLFNLLCRDGSCVEYAAPDVPFLSDADHLTKAGSILTAKRMAALGVLPSRYE